MHEQHFLLQYFYDISSIFTEIPFHIRHFILITLQKLQSHDDIALYETILTCYDETRIY